MKRFNKKSEKKGSEKKPDALYPDYIGWYNPATYGHPMIDEQWSPYD